MPSTFVHGLLPTTCLFASRGSIPKLNKRQWLFLFGIAFAAGNLPDLDLIPGLIWNEKWHYYHRNFGHNIFALSFWILVTRFLLVNFVTKEFSGKRGWAISISLVLSHVMFDAMSGALPNEPRHGVPVLFPFSSWEFLMPFQPFAAYQLGEHTNPLIAHVTSAQFWKRAFFAEIAVSITLFFMWCVSYYSVRLLVNRRKQTGQEPVPSQSNVA